MARCHLEDGSFGNAFPDQCPDGRGVIGHSPALLEATAQGHGIIWPLDLDHVPDTLEVMDLLEFCENYVPEMTKVLNYATFNTGDDILDGFLEDAREKFMDPNLKIRKEALEKIWDAYERLKTIEVGSDKKATIAALLAKAVKDPDLRQTVDEEMAELTKIGNTYMIRHTEKGKKPITESDQVDYFFHRMFAVVRLLLKGTNRGG